jgi:DNA-binding LacI/PurR family transcriptional regulator
MQDAFAHGVFFRLVEPDTYATIALAAGVNPKVVSERLGHASVAFTLQLYSHVLPSVDEEAAKRVADLMLRTGPVPNPFPKRIRTAIRAPIRRMNALIRVVAGAGFEPATSGL